MNSQGTGILQALPTSSNSSFLWKGNWAGKRVCLELFSGSDSNLPPALKFSLSFLFSLKEVEGKEGTTGQAQADMTSSCCDFHED